MEWRKEFPLHDAFAVLTDFSWEKRCDKTSLSSLSHSFFTFYRLAQLVTIVFGNDKSREQLEIRVKGFMGVYTFVDRCGVTTQSDGETDCLVQQPKPIASSSNRMRAGTPPYSRIGCPCWLFFLT